jgi:hypothetical protein
MSQHLPRARDYETSYSNMDYETRMTLKGIHFQVEGMRHFMRGYGDRVDVMIDNSLGLEAAKEKASHFISTAAEHIWYGVTYIVSTLKKNNEHCKYSRQLSTLCYCSLCHNMSRMDTGIL